MNPECPKCESDSTRRIPRKKTIRHRIQYFFGRFPWECLSCQQIFFSSKRYVRSKRHPLGEVYTETDPRPQVNPGAEERHSR